MFIVLLLAGVIAGVVVAILKSKSDDGGDSPTPGPGPDPDRPLVGYNPYVIDNKTIKVEFGQYSGQAMIPDAEDTFLGHSNNLQNLKYYNYSIETDPRKISTGLNN